MSVRISYTALMIVSAFALTACGNGSSNRDHGIDSGALLEDRTAGIWIDGNGCDHWIIDDGLEGYMSPRLADDGRPVCREGSVPYTTIDFDRSLFGN
jgi:hypothetical protein